MSFKVEVLGGTKDSRLSTFCFATQIEAEAYALILAPAGQWRVIKCDEPVNYNTDLSDDDEGGD